MTLTTKQTLYFVGGVIALLWFCRRSVVQTGDVHGDVILGAATVIGAGATSGGDDYLTEDTNT